MKLKMLQIPSVGIIALCMASNSFGGFMGSQVQGTWEAYTRGSVWQGQTFTGVVGDGVEYSYRVTFDGGFAGFDLDLSETTIRLTFQFQGPSSVYFAPHDFNGWVFRDIADQLPNFTDLSLGAHSNGISSEAGVILNVDDANTLVMNLSNLRGASSGDWIDFQVSFAPVPAPGAVAFIGLAGLLTRRRTSRDY